MVVAWLVLGVILLAFEMRHLAFYALFGALGCFAACVTALFVPIIAVQVAVAIIVAGLGIATVRPLMSKRLNPHEDHGPLGRGVAGTLVGEEVLTLDAVGDAHAPGHVRLAGERWLATSGSGSRIPEGAKVLVTAVQGTTLVVWPVDGVVAPELPSAYAPVDPAATADPEHAPDSNPSDQLPDEAGKEPS